MDTKDNPDLNPSATEPLFFTVSPTKFVIMSLATLSIYELYWLYKNWKIIAKRKNLSILPFWRAFFGYFHIWPLLCEFRKEGEARGMTTKLRAGAIAISWIFISLLWKLPDPLSLLSFLAVFTLLPAITYVQDLHGISTPHLPTNSKFSRWNWFGIVCGGLLFIFVVISSFYPEASS